MKPTRTNVFLSAALVALVAVAACVGIQAREHVLIPAMKLSWDSSVAASVEHGIADAENEAEITDEAALTLRSEAVKLGDALGKNDRTLLPPINWGSLQVMALRGIDARMDLGEIGVTVARIKRMEVANFNESFLLVVAR